MNFTIKLFKHLNIANKNSHYQRYYRQFINKKADKINENKPNKKFIELKNDLKLITIVITTTWCITRFLCEPILLQGPSMEPTIFNNDVIIAEKYTRTFCQNEYKRGDIVIVRSPMNPLQLICKRIVAIQGDLISTNRYRQNKIQQGHVWLMGDNQQNSCDSREFGEIPIGLIIGRVVFRIWPISRIGNLTETKPTETAIQ